MPRAKENRLRSHLESVRKQFADAESEHSIPDLAAMYGLPVTMAAETASKDLVTLIGVVTFAAA